MNDASHNVLQLDDLQELTDRELIDRFIRDGSPFRVDFGLGSLGSSADPGDIASDYMDASYFGERLAKYCSAITAATVHGKHASVVRFAMTTSDVSGLVAELRRIVPAFSFDDDPDIDIRDEVVDFDDNIFEAQLRLPELADNYMANFLSGTSYTENKEYWNARIPMLRLGFWRSFASHTEGRDFYASDRWTGMWIVIGDRAATEQLLARHGGFSGSASLLHDALSLRLNNHPHVIMTPSAVVEAPWRQLERAPVCVRRYIAPAQAARHPEAHDEWARFFRRPPIEWDRCYGFSWAMTEDGEAIVCGDRQVHLVAFYQSEKRLRPEAVRQLLAGLEHGSDVFRQHLGLNVAPLDWHALTPDRFEELCYDVLLRSGRFDERTFRKHGKTKSRDGGRDIEAWTLPRLSEPGEKWIFQCKFVTSGAALSGSKLVISDVIEQYDAKGFGVMTNEVIDSTLYDKLDKITGSRKVGHNTWDGARLQRFLAARPDLARRYFPAAVNLVAQERERASLVG